MAPWAAQLKPREPPSIAPQRRPAATYLIDDAELSEAVGSGQHTYHNYSHLHYGPLRLREALGNSLNIPAVKTLKFVGADQFLDRLRTLGVTSLTQHPDFYGDGLALGNGEVSLYEMAQAYTALARQGRYLPITALAEGTANRVERTVYSPAIGIWTRTTISGRDGDQDWHIHRLPRRVGYRVRLPAYGGRVDGQSRRQYDGWRNGRYWARHGVAFDFHRA